MMKGKRVRKVSLAVVCSVVIVLSACSDNTRQQEQEPRSTTKAVSQSSSSQSPETQVPPSQAGGAPTPAQTASVGDGGKCSALMTATCTACHNANRICEKLGKKSKDRWKRTVDRMIERGAKLTADEEAALLECLYQTVNLQDACR